MDVNSRSDAGFTPLHISSQQGHVTTVTILVEEGNANVDAVTKTGANPIYWAAHFGKIEVIEYLIEKGKKMISSHSLTVLKTKTVLQNISFLYLVLQCPRQELAVQRTVISLND